MFNIFRRWLRGKRIDAPSQTHEINRSKNELERSQQKLDEAIIARTEVKRFKERNDRFTLEAERAMRRLHG